MADAMALNLAAPNACFLDGFRVFFRHGSFWALLVGAVILSVIVRFTPLPFRIPGFFSLQAFAGIAQLSGMLFVVAYLTRRAPFGLRSWWPASLGTTLVTRTVGTGVAMACGLLLLVAAQWLLAFLSGDLHADVGTSAAPASLSPAYARMGVRTVLFSLVLLVWGQLLVLVLGRAGGLLSLFVLVFAGFLLPDLTVRHPSILPIVGILPDLASLSPLANVDRPGMDLWVIGPYLAAHVAQTMALTVVILLLKRAYGRSIDQLDPAS